MAIDFEDRIQAKRQSPARWTVGRLLNDVAIIMVAVPLGIYSVKGVTNCGSDLFALSLMLGLCYLGPKLAWKILKPLNDRIDRYLPNHAPDPKPRPLDDF
jgi:hypothetical protein